MSVDALLPMPRRSSDSIVAGMATMPSRSATFPYALRSILRQVDRVYLYLDGHTDIPDVVRGNPRIVITRSQDVPGLRANGKMLGLAREDRACLYVAVDDDIYYPRNFIASLRRALAAFGDTAVVGYHGSILARPLVRYNADRAVFPYTTALDESRPVDVLGTGAVMFSSRALRFDVRSWPFTNMVDLGLAIEAARANVPMICIARKRKSVLMLDGIQRDSIFAALKRDDSRQTELARQLLQLRAACLSSASLP
jgi:hypothetical protein